MRGTGTTGFGAGFGVGDETTRLVFRGFSNRIDAAASGVEGGSDIVTRQMMVMGLCVFVMGIVVLIDYRHYDRFAYVLYALCIGLLVLTLFILARVFRMGTAMREELQGTV